MHASGIVVPLPQQQAESVRPFLSLSLSLALVLVICHCPYYSIRRVRARCFRTGRLYRRPICIVPGVTMRAVSRTCNEFSIVLYEARAPWTVAARWPRIVAFD